MLSAGNLLSIGFTSLNYTQMLEQEFVCPFFSTQLKLETKIFDEIL